MNVCRVCGGPMVWSTLHNRAWCSIYGDHRACQPSLLMIAADDELHADDRSVSTRFQRKETNNDRHV